MAAACNPPWADVLAHLFQAMNCLVLLFCCSCLFALFPRVGWQYWVLPVFSAPWAEEGVALSVVSWWDVHWVGALVLVVVSSSLVRLSGCLPPDARALLHGCLECQSLPLLAADPPSCAKAFTVSVFLPGACLSAVR